MKTLNTQPDEPDFQGSEIPSDIPTIDIADLPLVEVREPEANVSLRRVDTRHRVGAIAYEPTDLPMASVAMRTKKRTDADDPELAEANDQIRENATLIPDVWNAYQNGGRSSDALRNQLVEHYFPIVRYNAERLWAKLPESVDVNDLISAGVFGLMDAIQAFDLDRGVKFETYCVPRVRGAMLDEIRTMDWVPRLVRAKASKLNNAYKDLNASLGRDPTDKELCAYFGGGFTQNDLETLRRDAHAVGVSSLGKKIYETDSFKDVQRGDLQEDRKAARPLDIIEANENFNAMLSGFSTQEKLVLFLYYSEELTMKQIGMQLELSESRVSQMHSAIISRLRDKAGGGNGFWRHLGEEKRVTGRKERRTRKPAAA